MKPEHPSSCDLDDKLALFRAGGMHRSATPISEAEARDLGAHLKTRYVCFEAMARVQSPAIISKAEASSFIGAYSYINDGGYLRGNVFIGRYCSIGRRVSIGAGSHRSDYVSTSPAMWFSTESRAYSNTELGLIYGNGAPTAPSARDFRLVLGSDVWVGDGAVLLPGITIGHGAIIAANAVVTKSVEPFHVVAGTPARPVKQRFGDGVIDGLLKSKWWNLDYSVLQGLSTGNVFAFIEQLSKLDEPAQACYRTHRIA